MNSSARNLLVFAALMVAVVLGSMLYVRRNEIGSVSPQPAPANQPVTVDPAQLHPVLVDALRALEARELEKARELLLQVPKDDPSYTLALQNLGLVQLGMGDLDASVATYLRLAKLQPQNPAVFVDLAGAQFRLGRNSAAAVSLLRALELDPELLPARYNLGLYRIAGNDVALAIPSYDRAIRADPEGAYFPRALDDLRALHELRPELPAVHYALAFFAKSIRQPQLEVQELEHFLALEPEGPAAEVARERLEEARAVLGGP